MIDLVLEGFEASLLACSLVLLLPGIAVAVAARGESTAGVAGYVVAVCAVGWLRFSATIGDVSSIVLALAFAASAALLIAPLLSRLDITSGTGGLLAGGAAAMLWVPCVGNEFGTLLNELPDGSIVDGFKLTIFTLAVLSPLLLLGSILHLIPNAVMIPVNPVLAVVGGGVLGLISIAVAVGLDDDIIGRLVELST